MRAEKRGDDVDSATGKRISTAMCSSVCMPGVWKDANGAACLTFRFRPAVPGSARVRRVDDAVLTQVVANTVCNGNGISKGGAGKIEGRGAVLARGPARSTGFFWESFCKSRVALPIDSRSAGCRSGGTSARTACRPSDLTSLRRFGPCPSGHVSRQVRRVARRVAARVRAARQRLPRGHRRGRHLP